MPHQNPPAAPPRTLEGLVELAFDLFKPFPPTYNHIYRAYLLFAGRPASIGNMVEFSMTFGQMAYDAKIQATHRDPQADHALPETYRLRDPDEEVSLVVYRITQTPDPTGEAEFCEYHEAVKTQRARVKFAPRVREALLVDAEAAAFRQTGQSGRHVVQIEEELPKKQ